MIGFITKIPSAFSTVNRVKRLIREGRDIPTAYRKMQDKYGELPEDAKDAWRELSEFIDAFLDLFPQTRD